MKRYYVFKHRDVTFPFERALLAEGNYKEINKPNKADFVFIDWDKPRHRKTCEELNEKGVPIFILPHSPVHSIVGPDIYPNKTKITCNFILSSEQQHIMDVYKYPYPTEVVGWAYSPIKQFRNMIELTSGSKKINVLLALNHPNTHGNVPMFERDMDDNARAIKVLLELQEQGFINLTIRYGGKLERNLKNTTFPVQPYMMEVATYTHIDTMMSIDYHDVVVANQTFAWFSIAAGKPTIMFGSDFPPHTIGGRTPQHWDVYGELLRYPHDLFRDEDPVKLINKAILFPPFDWRNRFIQPFNRHKFLASIAIYTQ